MQWGQPEAFWLLVPVLVAAGMEWRRRDAIARRLPHIARVWAGQGELIFGQRQLGRSVWRWRLWLGLALAVVAFAQPRWGETEQPVYDPASDVVVAMDMSRSMLARDVRPSRIEHGRLMTLGMLDKLVGVRVGLAPFAGNAFVQLPLSLDYQILIETLDSLNPDNFPRGGTRYSAMLDAALEAFDENSANERYLIVISDGETSDPNWREKLPQLQERNIRIVAVAVGTQAGAVIPAREGGVVRDATGAEVLSKADPGSLEAMAAATGGRYVAGNTYLQLADILEELHRSAPRAAALDQATPVQEERFGWALLPALLLLFASFAWEVPYRPHHKRFELPEAPPERRLRPVGLARSLSLVLLAALVAVSSHNLSLALDGDENAIGPNQRPSSPVDGQAIIVTNRIGLMLEREGGPNALDYAGFCIDTMGYIETKLQIREKPALSILADVAAAIEAGRSLEPEGAGWDVIAKRLEGLLKRTLAPAKVYAAESAGNVSLETLLAMAEDEQENRRQRNEPEDDGMEIPDELRDRPSRQGEGSAFGDLTTVAEPPVEEEQDRRRRRPTFTMAVPPQSGEVDLSLPLHRLAQIESEDSPARLYQLMESPELPVVTSGEDW
ncbi:vWA domain-containing protein [Actomonas aquatica]|uniref:VWA domain-containing protein n=1 Tax=Actomonas aquatica TaxID=2866162 RepID=A0ABZ1CCM0_9BACT|nr:VWA domain-containing protein [Opitutus sp. WL0086]WRQ89062.1 VWA domain-containing protein [Opitutus sp. WL0086]